MVILILVLIIIISFILIAYRTFIQRIIQEKDLQFQAEMDHQKELSIENIKGQEDERKRIAISVHDDIGNRLNILSLWLNNLEAENQEASKKVITTQITELIDSTRNISHSLYPVNLEKLGLVLYLQELATNLSQNIELILDIDPRYQKKDIFTEVQIYRVIQEFTTNVIKHSTANEVVVYIRNHQQYLTMIITDNGESFDYEKAKKGMGLKNIESRIVSMKGFYKWKNQIGKQSRLIINIPN
ncbi:sensor histidine kinase [Epilithonimonas hispanica]|uniref:sensor histidine kinase n=1 Tax=Epilithonimonas hispanica TaxID=358687 RepID=UPI001FE9C244|nr:ATP-binding protein [Epilithonimonas hispanica]